MSSLSREESGNGTWRPREDTAASGTGSTQEEGLALQPPKKKSKANQRRGKEFKIEYLKRFGLKVDARDVKNSEIHSVSCRFCFRFGREAQAQLVAAGKRRPLNSIKSFSKPWRTDAFVQHLTLRHSSKWKEFNDLTADSHESFFDVEEDGAAHANTIDAHIDFGENLFFWTRMNIVNEVTRELLFDHSEKEKVETALSIFKKDDEEGGDMELKVTTKRVMAFFLIIDYVGAGLSFRQAATVLSSTAERTGLHKLRGTREADVARFVRAAVGINLQIISDLLTRKDCWAYSLAFDGATVQGKSFLDVRIRFV
jgi:hypothetical protein